MTEDTRVCPVCKKFPPAGQVWSDFDGHVTSCAQKFYEANQEERRQQQKDDDLEALDQIFGGALLRALKAKL
jgi:hypothetical protein